ncbi:MAG: hypothetical protein GF331_09805 [Chitinivibrionales bacterium]|nr:hypothetical protein [Chitinivibrionales bacterium]
MSTHDQLIQRMIDELKTRGAGDIQSRNALESEYTMRMIGGHVPDISATLDNSLHLYAVITDDLEIDEHMVERWRAFADYAQRGAAKLHITLPHGRQDLLQRVPPDVKKAAEVMEI